MRAGVGYANQAEARVAGRRCAARALHAGDLAWADLGFAFCSGRLDADAFIEGIREVVGEAMPIVGGSAFGVITGEHLSYRGYPAALALLESDRGPCHVACAGELDAGERTAGRKLASALAEHLERPLLLFYETVKRPPDEDNPPVLNTSAPLLQGIEERLPGPPTVIGGGLVSGLEFIPGQQFCGDGARQQCAVGVVLPTGISLSHRVMHGCTPLDGLYRKITSAEGDLVREIDGQPAVQVIDRLYGDQSWRRERPVVSILTLGVNHGERYRSPQENKYVNRLIAGVHRDGKSIRIFEPDLEAGTEIQFMLRDAHRMRASACENARALMQEIAGAGLRPFLGLYIDCAGRSSQLSNTVAEEAAEVQRVFHLHGIPLLGFYSGVEIAPFLDRSRGLDWSGVLVALCEEDESWAA